MLGTNCLCGYRLTFDDRLLHFAEAVGERYLLESMPDDVAVPAADGGHALALLADMYDLTGEDRWRAGAMRLADSLMYRYLDADLPRGALGYAYYDSQMGPGFLLHGLARLALLAQDRTNCPVWPDYTAR